MLRMNTFCSQHKMDTRKKGDTRVANSVPTIPNVCLPSRNPLEHMPSIRKPARFKKSYKYKHRKFSQDTIVGENRAVKSFWHVPITTFHSPAAEVPLYSDYTPISHNILAENNRTLRVWPHFKDVLATDQEETEFSETLQDQFDLVNDRRPGWSNRAERARAFRPYAGGLLDELKITWETVLFLFLAQVEDINRISGNSHDVAALLLHREHAAREGEAEGLSKNTDRWNRVFARLPMPSVAQLTVAAFACRRISQACGFSMWRLARQSPPTRAQRSVDTTHPEMDFKFSSVSCRICFL